MMMFLYLAEAISIDIVLYNRETKEEEIILPCFNTTRNYSDPNMQVNTVKRLYCNFVIIIIIIIIIVVIIIIL